MPLPIPNLDDRSFQQIVDEAKRRIALRCPEWTDHNVSDPGVTLIELFAWMVELLIYRLNRVPEKNYLTFLELLGLRLEPPTAARADLTFYLSDPERISALVLVEQGSEVATAPQQAGERQISFTTDEELAIYPAETRECLTVSSQDVFEDHSDCLHSVTRTFPAFSRPRPVEGDCLYISFSNDLSRHILALEITNDRVTGFNVRPEDAPLVWETWCGDDWSTVQVWRDYTGGLNEPGRVELDLPVGMTPRQVGQYGAGCYWLRCRYHVGVGQKPYESAPELQKIQALTLGATVTATHATTISGEVLGRGRDQASQTFQLEYPPVLPNRHSETVVVEVQPENEDECWQEWAEVANFGGSLPDSRHFVLDRASGVLNFGPLVREPDGRVRQYGAVPPTGRIIRVRSYRSGGGVQGNVGVDTIKVLRQGQPFVQSVTNRQPAQGGRDAEQLERALLRAPALLRTRDRAVTAEDYEYLAREAAPERVARARCLVPESSAGGSVAAGALRLLIVPVVAQPGSLISRDQLELAPSLRHTLQTYLDERRLLTVAVSLATPRYIEVSVYARLKARRGTQHTVGVEARARLYRFLNPLQGGVIAGPSEDGWPFGRTLYIAEIYALLQNIPQVEHIVQVTLSRGGQAVGQKPIELPPDGLIMSATHQVDVE